MGTNSIFHLERIIENHKKKMEDKFLDKIYIQQDTSYTFNHDINPGFCS
jgi:hypothetical protein